MPEASFIQEQEKLFIFPPPTTASTSAAPTSFPTTSQPSPATEPSPTGQSSPTSQPSVALKATTTSDVAEEEVEGAEDDGYSKRSNLLKIAVPVLLCVALILILSGVIVSLTFCLCERNRR